MKTWPTAARQQLSRLKTVLWQGVVLAALLGSAGCGSPLLPSTTAGSTDADPAAPRPSSSETPRSSEGSGRWSQVPKNKVTGAGSGDDATAADRHAPPPALTLAGAEVAHDSGLGIDVAVLHFDLKDADFAQVLRCKSSFRLRLPDGSRVGPAPAAAASAQPGGSPAEAMTDDRKRDLEWAWRDAFAATQSCALVALRALPGRFEDSSSYGQDGGFYYALNPCTLDPEEPEDVAAASCSYDLALTKDLAAPRGAAAERKDLMETLSLLAQARSDAEGLATSLRALAASAQDLVPICQRQNAREESLSLLRQGLSQLAAIGVVAATSQAGGLLAIPFVQSQIRTVVQGLFARPPRVPPACQQLYQIVDKTKAMSESHREAFQRWSDLTGTLEALRKQP